MRIKSDQFYEELTADVALTEFQRIKEVPPDNLNEMKNRLKKLQRKRHLIMWHDGSTISNHGHLLITVACLYDEAVHLTDTEFYQKYSEYIYFLKLIQGAQMALFTVTKYKEIFVKRKFLEFHRFD